MTKLPLVAAAAVVVALLPVTAGAPLMCPDPETPGARVKCRPGQAVEVRPFDPERDAALAQDQRIRELEAMVQALDARIVALEIAKIAQKKGTSTGVPGLDNGN
jgi:hypothetical protein